jgi:hypothetical protein
VAGDGTRHATAPDTSGSRQGNRARLTFRDQLAKGSLDASLVREARVDIVRSSASAEGLVNGSVVAGHDVVLTARAVSDLGGVYTRNATIFVAAHDPHELAERAGVEVDVVA